jgi:tRNA-binding protein
MNNAQIFDATRLLERKMAGEVSQGMLFDIGYAHGIVPCLAIPENQVPNGSRAG